MRWLRERRDKITQDVLTGVIVLLIGAAILSAVGLIPRPGFVSHGRHPDPLAALARLTASLPPLVLTATYDRGVYSDGWVLDVPDREVAASAFTPEKIHECGSLWDAARGAGGVDVGMTHLRVLA